MTTAPQENPRLTVRPMTEDEYPLVVEYFHDAPDELLLRMGVERGLLPPRQQWLDHLLADHGKPLDQADRLWLSWLVDSRPVGHSSLSDMVPGEHSHIHLHLWHQPARRQGLGTRLFRLAVAHAFQHLDLARVYCEPKADNPAPNRVLKSLGFQLLETRWTRPGAITFEQHTNLYMLERPPHLARP